MSLAPGSEVERKVSKLSVVIPSYKSEKLVARTIESVLAEGVPEKNIIIVEDGSFDNTDKVIKKYPEAVFIRKEINEGAPRARNDGLRQVKTEFVMFLDSDDYVEGGLLRALVKEISTQQADIAFGPWCYSGENRSAGKVRLAPWLTASDWVFYWLLHSCVPTCSVVWRTSYVISIGAWDERLKKNQDGELAVRALMSEAKIAVTNKGCGIYWQHISDGRISNASVVDRLHASSILYEQLINWLRSHGDSRLNKYECSLGKYCCMQAWAAASGGDVESMKCWFERANQHGYFKKHYSRATMLLKLLGVPVGAKLKSLISSCVKNKLQS